MKKKLLIGGGLYLGAGVLTMIALAARGRGLNYTALVIWPWSIFNEFRPSHTVSMDVRATVDHSRTPKGTVGADHGGGMNGALAEEGPREVEVIKFA